VDRLELLSEGLSREMMWRCRRSRLTQSCRMSIGFWGGGDEGFRGVVSDEVRDNAALA
jgi:hypothetical protein